VVTRASAWNVIVCSMGFLTMVACMTLCGTGRCDLAHRRNCYESSMVALGRGWRFESVRWAAESADSRS
jgi:hypothetical protein